MTHTGTGNDIAKGKSFSHSKAVRILSVEKTAKELEGFFLYQLQLICDHVPRIRRKSIYGYGLRAAYRALDVISVNLPRVFF